VEPECPRETLVEREKETGWDMSGFRGTLSGEFNCDQRDKDSTEE